MKPVFEFTKGMREMTTSYCPGCTHGIAHRLIMEVLEEKGALGNAIGVSSPVGCSIVAHQFMNVDMMESHTEESPAAASGIKRVHRIRMYSHIREMGIWRPSEQEKSSTLPIEARSSVRSSLTTQSSV